MLGVTVSSQCQKFETRQQIWLQGKVIMFGVQSQQTTPLGGGLKETICSFRWLGSGERGWT